MSLQGEENTLRHEENGEVVMVTEHRVLDGGNRKGHIVIKVSEILLQAISRMLAHVCLQPHMVCFSGNTRASDGALGGGTLGSRPNLRRRLPPHLPHLPQESHRRGRKARQVVRKPYSPRPRKPSPFASACCYVMNPLLICDVTAVFVLAGDTCGVAVGEQPLQRLRD